MPLLFDGVNVEVVVEVVCGVVEGVGVVDGVGVCVCVSVCVSVVGGVDGDCLVGFVDVLTLWV